MQLSKREKYILPSLIIVLAVLAWQLYLLIIGPTVDAKSVQTEAHDMPTMVLPHRLNTIPQPSVQAVSKHEGMSNIQQHYVELVNAYQLSQMREMIARSHEAIAVAKRNEASAELASEKIRKQLLNISEVPQTPSDAHDVAGDTNNPDFISPDTMLSKSDKPVLTKPQVAKQHANVATAYEPKPKLSADEKAIMSTEPQSYTIELFINQHEESVKNFIKQPNIAKQFHTFTTKQDDKLQTIAIYGHYANQSEAYTALKNLPIEFHRWHPYVRRMSSIQKQITSQSRMAISKSYVI